MTAEPETKKTSPKTTTAGVLAFVAALAQALYFQFDGVETTSPEWGLVGAAALTAFALWKARDHDVSSKAAGISGD